MTTNNEQVIPKSKIKLFLMFFGALAFVVAGFFFVSDPEKFLSIKARSEEFISLAGFAAILFFGLCAIFVGIKLFDNKPGFIIKETGFWDNSSGVSAGFVEWADIEELSIMEINKQKIILIHLKDPEKYINKQKNIFKKKMMQINFNWYQAPISLTSNGLKCGFNELVEILEKGIEKNKEREHNKI